MKALVVGQVTLDTIFAGSSKVERLGGVAYAASVFQKLGMGVTLAAHVGASHEESARIELESRQIRPKLFSLEGPAIAYEIRNADEVITQSTIRFGPEVPIDAPKLSLDDDFDVTLIYPLRASWAESVIGQIKSQCRLIALDLQHDISNLIEVAHFLNSVHIILTNEEALFRLTNRSSLESAAIAVREQFEGILVVKRGLAGCIIFDKMGKKSCHPAYLANFEITVGAGDAYDAAFLTSFSAHEDIGRAAHDGAKVAAHVVESTSFNPASEIQIGTTTATRTGVFVPENSQLLVYIAGHFHSDPVKHYISYLAAGLEKIGLRTFVPHRDIGVVGIDGVTPAQAFNGDISGLEECDAIVALLDGAYRGGTYFELGYCHKRSVPSIIWSTDRTLGISNMVTRSSQGVFSDVKHVVNAVLELVAKPLS